jgi:wyosine [tRNA(Phe)-imidazoG37] synthetase (radical SAM superfamily)
MSGKVCSAESQDQNAIAYGPVPSRRLGRSLGINNIPAKICTYSCVYCQLGRTTRMPVDRKPFYDPERIFAEVQEKVGRCRAVGESIDYLTFVPDGEPTLDVNLGREIELLRNLGVKIAVLTNASLIDRDDVKDELAKADLVSLKVDAVSEDTWRRVNGPQRSLNLSSILAGMRDFAKMFRGQVISETMLIEEVNDTDEEIRKTTGFLMGLQPSKAYIAIPTRPPADTWVHATGEDRINLAYQILSASLGMDRVEYLIGYEGDAFASTGRIEEDLLSITSVHPMRREAVEHLLRKAGSDWSVVECLIKEDKLIQIRYGGHDFYMRRLPSRSSRAS